MDRSPNTFSYAEKVPVNIKQVNWYAYELFETFHFSRKYSCSHLIKKYYHATEKKGERLREEDKRLSTPSRGAREKMRYRGKGE